MIETSGKRRRNRFSHKNPVKHPIKIKNIKSTYYVIYCFFCISNQKWKNSDEEKVHLEKIDFDAAGKYYCEVSTDTPIFTKESNVEQVHVIGKIDRIHFQFTK